MLPLHDTHPTRTFPIVNYAIILINVLVFAYQTMMPDPDVFIRSFGFISSDILRDPAIAAFTAFTSMWLHGGILHIVSNMWFLHIFGDNVEDRIGHFRFMIFYVLAGLAAIAAQTVANPGSSVPMVGASGAIAGVTGAYFVILRNSSIVALVPTFFGIWQKVELPAWFFLGYWLVLQVLSGMGSFASMDSDVGGIAFFAHIGGFAFGYSVAKLFYGSRVVEYEDD